MHSRFKEARHERSEEMRLGKGDYALEKLLEQVSYDLNDHILDNLEENATKIPRY